MIHEEDKNNNRKNRILWKWIIGNDEKKSQQEKQTVINRDDFAKPDVNEEALMQVIAGTNLQETESGTTQTVCKEIPKTTSKPKKLTKEDYCGQFFKIPTTTASKGKSVYMAGTPRNI